MEFTYKRTYKSNKLYEKFLIDNKEVDKHTYDLLDTDSFENIKNTKIDKETAVANMKYPNIHPISEKVKNKDEFIDAIVEIVNHIKVSKVNDGVENIIELIESVGNEQYLIGYADAILQLKDDLGVAYVKFVKKSQRRSK